MTKAAIQNQLEAGPFRPFAVRLVDGRRFDIPRPDFASLSPGGRILTVYTQGDSPEEDGVHLLDVALIAEIETRSRNGA